jgi:hypothetical protein
MTDDDVLQKLRAAWSGRGLVRWLDDADKVERRQHQVGARKSAIGRSSVLITCPFCGAVVEAFTWSLAGSGKRCTCGALHGPRGTSMGWKTDDSPHVYHVKDAVISADDSTVRGRVLDVLFDGTMLTVKWFGGDVVTIPADKARPAPSSES